MKLKVRSSLRSIPNVKCSLCAAEHPFSSEMRKRYSRLFTKDRQLFVDLQKVVDRLAEVSFQKLITEHCTLADEISVMRVTHGDFEEALFWSLATKHLGPYQ